jgi:general secretion pathway protein L
MESIVIQLAPREVLFARFRRDKTGLALLEGGRLPRDPAGRLPELPGTFLAAAREQGRVVLALPAAAVSFREVTLPLTDRHKVRQVLPLELKGETAQDTEELVFDALPLAEGKMLAAWVKRQVVAGWIEALAGLGLEPEIVTVALCGWGVLLPAEARSGVAALCDGEGVAVYRDGTPLFLRAFGTAGDAGELRRTLATLELAKGITVERVFTWGGLAPDLPGSVPLPLAGELATAFGGDGAAAADLAGAWAVARACSVGQPVNFRTGELADTRGSQQLRRRLRLTLTLAAALALLVFAEAGVRYFQAQRDLASLNGSIGAIYREVFPKRQKPVDEVGELRGEIRRLSASTTAAGSLPLLRTLAELKGDDLVGFFEIEVEGNQVRLKGDARSIQAVNDFKARAAAVLAAAEVSEIKARPDGSVSFAFRGTLKEGGK